LAKDGLTNSNYKEYICLEIYAEEQENLIKMRDYDMHHVWLKPVYMGGGMDYVVRNKKTG
jgi:hypothetical protein